jgi:hypothetical protein
VVSPDLSYELVEYAEDIPSEAQEYETGDFEAGEELGQMYENPEGQPMDEEQESNIQEMDLNMEHYDFSQVQIQPGFEVVAQVNLGTETENVIQMNGHAEDQELIYFTSSTCSNDIPMVSAEGVTDVGPAAAENPLQFFVYM